MQEFKNTAREDLGNKQNCPYYDICYLQVRNSGICFQNCKDNPNRKDDE